MKYEAASWNTRETGCQPGVVALKAYAASLGIGDIGCFNDRAVRGGAAPSLHREGRAVDLLPADNLTAFLDRLIGHYAEVGVQQVIWQRRYWRCDAAPGWHPYNGTDPHTGHAHVELTWPAAKALTGDAIAIILEDELTDDQITKLAGAIAEAIMGAEVPNHDYSTGQDTNVSFRTWCAWLKQEISKP